MFLLLCAWERGCAALHDTTSTGPARPSCKFQKLIWKGYSFVNLQHFTVIDTNYFIQMFTSPIYNRRFGRLIAFPLDYNRIYFLWLSTSVRMSRRGQRDSPKALQREP